VTDDRDVEQLIARKRRELEEKIAAAERLSDVEQIARAAVTLCADLLRRYQPIAEDTSWRTRYELNDTIAEWGERVLAWQDQLDQQPP
jgi:hypothetical protein